MAVQGSGVHGIEPGMSDPTSSTLPRQGAAKRVQIKFPVKWDQRETINLDVTNGASGNGSVTGDGPDASSPNPLFRVPISKGFKDAPAAWQMRDANGQSINHEQGRQILAEGALTGRK